MTSEFVRPRSWRGLRDKKNFKRDLYDLCIHIYIYIIYTIWYNIYIYINKYSYLCVKMEKDLSSPSPGTELSKFHPITSPGDFLGTSPNNLPSSVRRCWEVARPWPRSPRAPRTDAEVWNRSLNISTGWNGMKQDETVTNCTSNVLIHVDTLCTLQLV